ncbi:MAG: nuclear transport factor 2 family protein [Solirubrobacterales bacterium]
MTTATGNGTAGNAEAEAWVEMFSEGWANPVDADTFCDHFDPWLHPEVRMIQPQIAPLVGKDAFRERFARPLFALVPDLHGTVKNWAAGGDVVYIELRLEGTIGRRPFAMDTCDRIKLRDGKAVERIAYLDATPLIKAVARSPRSWSKFLTTQLRNLRRPA